MSHKFVGLPKKPYEKIYLYSLDGEKFRQVIWGDYLKLADESDQNDEIHFIVLWAWNHDDENKRKKLKIKKEHVVDKRPLEIIFVDVGQGDGAVLITPERDANEKIIVIDAGKEDHMFKFLKDRFFSYRKSTGLRGFNFHAAIMTHPDIDHYGGFKHIFSCDEEQQCTKVTFDRLYHNGIVELPKGDSWEKFGGKIKYNGSSFINHLIEKDEQMRESFSGDPGDRNFGQVINKAISKKLVTKFQMLSTKHGKEEGGKLWVPGFAPSDRDYNIQVLGPYVETLGDGSYGLKTFGSGSKTKNGHSVLLKLTYEKFSILFGGDLNLKSEKYLLKKYTKFNRWPSNKVDKKRMIKDARDVFQSDVMKTCHHGSSDVTDEFLQSVNPLAFVISSGDEEGHVHPRPDLIGRLGRNGRGDKPVILSTELQRSTREDEDAKLVRRLKKNINWEIKKQLKGRQEKIQRDIDVLSRSNVSVDGAIYVKTDGENLITAFKKETDSPRDRWFYFHYKVDENSLEMLER